MAGSAPAPLVAVLALEGRQRMKLAVRAANGSAKSAWGGTSEMADIVQMLDKDLRKRWLNLDQIAYMDVSGGSATVYFSGGLKLTLYEDETAALVERMRAGKKKAD